MAYSAETLRAMQVARLQVMLAASFTDALHITLCFDDVSMPESRKRADVRNLMARIRGRAGHALRYVSVTEYAENGQDIKAFHYFMDGDADVIEYVCRRWRNGAWSVANVDLTQPAALPAFMYSPASARAKRRLYNTSDFVLTTASA